MVIHAGGGVADVSVDEGGITIILEDHGPGIEDISLAMQEGYSTAPDNVADSSASAPGWGFRT